MNLKVIEQIRINRMIDYSIPDEYIRERYTGTLHETVAEFQVVFDELKELVDQEVAPLLDNVCDKLIRVIDRELQ